MTPEAKLLIACCRRFLQTDDSENLSEAVRGVNWDLAMRLADAHAIMPLVYSAMPMDVRASIPDAANRELAERFRANACRNLSLTAELLKILALLTAEGVQAIPLKGPILALQAYGDLSFRAFFDLDLLVSPADVPLARQVLVDNGYLMNSALPSSGESAYMKIKEQELCYVRADGEATIDLHWGLQADYRSGLAAWEGALNHAQSVTVAGRSVPCLSTEDLLLFLCAHGGRHLWARLGWICDVAGVVRSRPDIDWRSVLAEAARQNVLRTVSVGLLLAADVLNVPLPNETIRLIRADRVACRLARDIQERMFSEIPVGKKPIEFCQVRLRMIEGFANRLRYLADFVITPGEAEFRVLQLPRWLYHLYYPFRMARLFAKYAWAQRRPDAQ